VAAQPQISSDITTMTSQDYLIEMTFSPFASLPTPPELVAFIERMALPTMEALERLAASGRILAGGSVIAAGGFVFIARVGSPQELEELVSSLPLAARAETRVVPLGTFRSRADTIRERLARARAALPAPA
jgi:hypothetical protein